MGFRVVITKPAINDLAEIVCYIAGDNPEAATRVGNGLIDRAESLGELPYRGRVFPNAKSRVAGRLFGSHTGLFTG